MAGVILRGTHETSFVLLSIVIAIAAAYAALDLAGRATAGRGRVRVAWIIGGAVAMGIGINAMHFVGMLGYYLPFPVLYDVPTVLASLLAAILASWVALFVVSRPDMRPGDALIGSLFMGAGIVTMHYTGMAAMRLAADAHYDPLLVVLSIVVAISVSLVGLWLVFYLRDPSVRTRWWRVGGAVVMGLAIPSMHYVAMAAVHYTPVAKLPDVSNAIQISSLGAALIGVATLTILSLVVLTSVVDRRLEAQATALAKSEQRYQQLVESGQVIVWKADPETFRFHYVSQEAEALLGYPLMRWTNEPAFWIDHIHPEDREVATEFRRRATRLKQVHQFEYRMFAADGRVVWLRDIVSVVAKDGQPEELVGTMVDITIRKQAEEALRESEERFRSVTQSANDAIISADSRGTILSWNKGARAIFGYEEAEVRGQPLTLLMPERYRAAHLQGLKRVQAGGESRVIGRTVELHGLRKDGGEFPLELSLSAWKTRGETFYSAIIRDITAHKRLENERDRFFTLSLDLLCIAGFDGYFKRLNPAWEHALGHTVQELLVTPYLEFVHPDDRGTTIAEAKKVAAGAHVLSFENRYRCKDGSYRLLQWKAVPDVDQQLTYAVARDITDRKQLEEQLRRKNEELEQQNRRVQEANRLKSEFLANMSHELRTPLNSIIGFTQLMHDGKAGPLRPDQKEYLGDILTSSRHLLQLINDVLDLSKVESGKMEFFPEVVEVRALVGEVRDILRSIAGSNRITVKAEVEPNLREVTIDSAKFKQVLYNYLSNALKFTPDEGQVTIRVMAEGADRFRLEVEDTGIGIKPEDLSRLFIEFQQLDASAAKKYPGTGLGLALTKRLVEAQGGSVGVRSTYGQGSVFFAVLPRMTHQVQPVEPTLTALPRQGAPKVLVVEDERKDRNWLSKTVGEAGYQVETATTGAEALGKCHEQVFDAIMLDLLLPDMNGRDVLAVIQREGLNQHTPVIVVTVVSEKGIMAGYDVHDIFQKPAEGQQLLASLKRAGIKPDDSGPVLVVDDDPNMLKLGKRTLEKLGYNPICLESPRGALGMIAQSHPVAIVTDIRFPGTDVFEFLSRLRTTEAGRQIPVIVWTAGDVTGDLRERLQSSVRAVVLRSQGPEALVQAVQACVPLPASKASAEEVPRGR